MKLRNLRATISVILLFLGLSCASVSPGHDPVVVNAERTTALALEVFDSFLKWEFDNRTALAVVPDVRRVADVIRRDGIGWLESARRLTVAYKANRTEENKAALNTGVAVLRVAVQEASGYLAKYK
jgi:hypothetical protein